VSINLNIYQKILSKIDSFQKKTELLVVSKNRSLEELMPCIIEKNHKLFGENRVQEAQNKFTKEIISKFDLRLNLIGPLQTNKVDIALNLFNTIQTLDRLKLVKEIHKSMQKRKFPIVTKNFFIQVNIGDENQKSGVDADHLPALYEECLRLDLDINGLMCIPPANVSSDQYFEKMCMLRESLNTNLKLSMGMSNDYEVALKFKSDIIRIGSLLFS